MAAEIVWVQGQAQQTGAGVRIWHLAAMTGETLCGRPTQAMKVLPKAEWGLVLNPCAQCQEKADLAEINPGLAS